MATKIKTATIVRPMIVKRFILRNSKLYNSHLPDSDPGIEPSIDHIRKHVCDYVSHADHEDAALHDAIITFTDTVFNQQETQTRPAKDLFRNDCAGEQNAEL